MCGITGIINFNKKVHHSFLQQGTSIISHRGPDDEGFLLWGEDSLPKIYSGDETSFASKQFHELESIRNVDKSWKIGLGHRRLSIIDLSPTGHQPMLDKDTGVSISYNGEIYNYRELRHELQNLGHSFISHSDTEVVLRSWIEWGPLCLNKFNGMFGILVLDTREGGNFYAVRDRFGVKPLYWTKTFNYFAFASEIKQLKVLPDYQSNLNENIAYDYLAYGQLDHTNQTFDKNIFQLRGGEIMTVNLSNYSHKIEKWYTIPNKKWNGTSKEAIEKFEDLLTDSVRLRLRSDVPIGSCLSGGLDSSAIVCMMAKILKNQPNNGIKTITACFENKKYDEWEFAEAVVNQTGAEPHKVFPSFDNLTQTLEKVLWHMDEPFGSTSQYSQWCVFKGAADANLKVMLDGQGSDEQLAGYNGNEISLYAGLIKELKLLSLFNELYSYKKLTNTFPVSQLIGGTRRILPILDLMLPSSWKSRPENNLPSWFKKGYKVVEGKVNTPKSLRDNLEHQTLFSSLPALLRYEDRNSMAWSIESRVPFLDYRLVEFIFSLPESLLYNKGVKKYILREALQDTFPKKIYERRDKMGFVTPEEVWIKGEGKDWFQASIEKAALSMPELLDATKVNDQINKLLIGKENFNFSYWRLACMGLYLK